MLVTGGSSTVYELTGMPIRTCICNFYKGSIDGYLAFQRRRACSVGPPVTHPRTQLTVASQIRSELFSTWSLEDSEREVSAETPNLSLLLTSLRLKALWLPTTFTVSSSNPCQMGDSSLKINLHSHLLVLRHSDLDVHGLHRVGQDRLPGQGVSFPCFDLAHVLTSALVDVRSARACR